MSPRTGAGLIGAPPSRDLPRRAIANPVVVLLWLCGSERRSCHAIAYEVRAGDATRRVRAQKSYPPAPRKAIAPQFATPPASI